MGTWRFIILFSSFTYFWNFTEWKNEKEIYMSMTPNYLSQVLPLPWATDLTSVSICLFNISNRMLKDISHLTCPKNEFLIFPCKYILPAGSHLDSGTAVLLLIQNTYGHNFSHLFIPIQTISKSWQLYLQNISRIWPVRTTSSTLVRATIISLTGFSFAPYRL